jgi:hypothetical protein
MAYAIGFTLSPLCGWFGRHPIHASVVRRFAAQFRDHLNSWGIAAILAPEFDWPLGLAVGSYTSMLYLDAVPIARYCYISVLVLRPVGPVQRPVLDGFCNVLRFERSHTLKIGNGARHFYNAIVGARAQALLSHCSLQQAFAIGGQPAVGTDLR